MDYKNDKQYIYTTHTTATKTQTHVQHSPCPHRIGKAQTQFSHPLTPLSTHTAPIQTIHMSHTPPTPLTSMSPVLDKTLEPRIPLIHALTATTPHPDPSPALPSPSHPSHSHSTHTCNTNNSTCITVISTTARTT